MAAAAALRAPAAARGARRGARCAPAAARAAAARAPRCAAGEPAEGAEEVPYGSDVDANLRPDCFLALGLAHCFALDADGKLQDAFVLEPIPAGAYEAMLCGSKTSYTHVVGVTWEQVEAMDVDKLPEEFRAASFAEDFEFRAKAALRTWQRPHAIEKLTPELGTGDVRGGEDFNFDISNKRVLNHVHEVDDSDNIKQDMSIDVYGRDKDEKATKPDASVEELYNA